MKIPLKYGLFMALAGAAFTLVMYFAGFHENAAKMGSAQTIGFVSIFAISTVFLALAMKEKRATTPADANWGYGSALGTGVLTGLFSAFFGAIFAYCYFAFINPAMCDVILQVQLDAMEAKGMPAAQMERAEPMMRKWMSPPMMTVMQAATGFMMSTVLAAIVAIFFKRRDAVAVGVPPPTLG